MSNFQDLIALIGNDNGKVFVVDEKGDLKLVVLSAAEYQKLLLGKLQKQIVDIEKINAEITKAQLQDEVAPPASSSVTNGQGSGLASGPAVQTYQANGAPSRVDLRAEVIDPTFDFDAPSVQIEDL